MHPRFARRRSFTPVVTLVLGVAVAGIALAGVVPPDPWQRSMVKDQFFGAAAVAMADVDRDGLVDIVVAARAPVSRVSWFRNPGLYVIPVLWMEYVIDPNPDGDVVPAGATDVDCGDIDRDGDADVVVAFGAAGTLVWYACPPDPLGVRSWPKTTIGSLVGARSVALADIDGDRDLDAVAAGFTVAGPALGEVVWFENPGALTPVPDQPWTRTLVDARLGGAAGVFAHDLNGDGSLDIVAAGSLDNAVVWYRNPGPRVPIILWPKFVIDAPSPDGSSDTAGLPGATAVWAGDLTGDGIPDVAAVGETASTVAWYQAPDASGTSDTWLKNVLDNTLAGACAITGCDIDRDGNDDLVACGRVSGEIAWYWNPIPRDVLWQKHTIDPAAGDVGDVATGGVDAGAFPDVAAAATRSGTVVWYRNPLEPSPTEFIRGDARLSIVPEQPDITDMQAITNYLAMRAGHGVGHFDAADANDDGFLTFEDVIRLGRWLFVGPPSLPAPFPEPGEDPTDDRITRSTVMPPKDLTPDKNYKVWLYWATDPNVPAGAIALLRLRIYYPAIMIPGVLAATQAHAAIAYNPQALEFVGARTMIEGWENLLVELPSPEAGDAVDGIGVTVYHRDCIREPRLIPYDEDLLELRFVLRQPSADAFKAIRLVETVGEADPVWLWYYTGAGYFGFSESPEVFPMAAMFTMSLRETGSRFIRGDANADGGIDIGDAIRILSYLFGSGREPSCLDTADVNDDGETNIGDPIRLLAFLFAHGSPPPPPFGPIPKACGLDTTHDDLSCTTYDPCYDPILTP